ncbi:WD40/YVTN/BNR-like repeat-containing protein [Winogradskyella maritima]|uniref:WD40/YVTN/BNR-like repeat-containing protein n=1 Tax=Winogradskyella maritima TaxID=1517766 RepID=A0ABV8AHW7_9FLAO
MRHLTFLLALVLCFSCKNEQKRTNKTLEKTSIIPYDSVEISAILEDSLLNVRALEVYNGKMAVATSQGDFYTLFNDGKTFGKVSFDSISSNMDSIGNNNFRSLAIIKDSRFKNYYPLLGVTITSPTKLYKNGILKYQEAHPDAFYDSMDFWNDQEGIAIGDPTDDCISIIITRDGGESWTKLSCDDLPKAKDGEAAFAASDTNIAIVGDETWVATGGKASRILYSPNKGQTWEVFETPIIQELETTGMYSLDFYDAKNGFAIGGDYTKPNDSIGNKIRTNDGGRTWVRVGDGQSPGYRSCIQYFPNSDAKSLVAVGFKGIDISHDAGDTWKHLSDEGFYTLRFLNDSMAYAAGRGRVSKLVFR